MLELGVALSGGGSRAAAFHRGTLQALLDLGLVEKVDVVSTVSGGSLFGGAWMAARSRREKDSDFLGQMGRELKDGFIGRSLRPWDVLKAIVPGIDYSRSDLIAETFDEIFFHKAGLGSLPDRPTLCINTTLLENGQVGKFTKSGFSAWGLRYPAANPPHQVPMPDYPLASAVAASAAFPVGLPPMKLGRKRLAQVEFAGSLVGAKNLHLTDGGVLENLGIQTLLRSERFRTWNLIVSDAGTADKRWRAVPVLGAARGLGAWIAGGRILDRVMLIMNDKENRWARQQVIDAFQDSWIEHALQSGQRGSGLDAFLQGRGTRPRRDVLFVRIDQTWSSFLGSVPRHRLVEIADASRIPLLRIPAPGDVAAVESFLKNASIDLEQAKAYYQKLGGDRGAEGMNGVSTNFTGIMGGVIDQLSFHAAWQLHAAHAIYGLAV